VTAERAGLVEASRQLRKITRRDIQQLGQQAQLDEGRPASRCKLRTKVRIAGSMSTATTR